MLPITEKAHIFAYHKRTKTVEIEQNLWGFSPEGEGGLLYTMRNASGGEVLLTNAGAALVGVRLPNGDGSLCNVVAGYDTFAEYVEDTVGMGKIIGRTSGVITRGRLVIDEQTSRLAVNQPPHHVDGGRKGFGARMWEARTEVNRVVFALESAAGDEGYPSGLRTEVIYDWDDDNRLEVTVVAQADGATPIDITTAPLFDLSGKFTPESISRHRLQVNASRYVAMRGDNAPTGELPTVEVTDLDFRSERELGDLDTFDGLIGERGGLDHWLVVDGWQRSILSQVATLADPQSGRTMNLYSSQPALHLYSANAMSGSGAKRDGREYEDHSAIALHCMALPDAVNHAEFPSIVMQAGELYVQKTVYEFL